MNEPYQPVHKQADSNSSLYRNIGIDVGLGVAFTGVFDGIGVMGKKYAKTPQMQEIVKLTAYTDNKVKDAFPDFFEKPGKIREKVGKIPVYGSSTTKGRIFGYGTSLLGGMMTGYIRTDKE